MKNRNTQQEQETEDFSTRLADYTICIAIIGAGISIGSAILGFRLFTLDPWLNFLQGIPLIFATLASGAAVASSFFHNQRQYVLAQASTDAQTKELMRQRYERMVDSVAEIRIFLLFKRDVPSDPMVRVTESRAAVEHILGSITPYLADIDNRENLKKKAKEVIDHRSIIKESQYIKHLLRLSSIAEEAGAKLNDKSIADYIWVRLFPEELLLCTIMHVAGQKIAIPSSDQLENLQFVLMEMIPWERNKIDLKSLFTT